MQFTNTNTPEMYVVIAVILAAVFIIAAWVCCKKPQAVKSAEAKDSKYERISPSKTRTGRRYSPYGSYIRKIK
jgi:hypothetical protein